MAYRLAYGLVHSKHFFIVRIFSQVRRDHLLLVLLYNTGARISELLALRVQDVLGPQAKQVELQGKGRKRRTLPLWRQTQRLLRRRIRDNRLAPSLPLLPNRPESRVGPADRPRGRCPQDFSPHFSLVKT